MSLPQGKVIKLKDVRLSFPSLDIPRKTKGYEDDENAPAMYRASFLLDPKNPEHVTLIKQCNAEIKRLITETWGTKPAKMDDITCFGKGETQIRESGEVYDGYEGMYYVSSSNVKLPRRMNRQMEDLSNDQAQQVLYGGCYVTASVNFWVQDNKHGKAIRCSLRGVQFKGEGEAFGAGVAGDDEFDNDDDLGAGNTSLDDDFDGDELDL